MKTSALGMDFLSHVSEMTIISGFVVLTYAVSSTSISISIFQCIWPRIFVVAMTVKSPVMDWRHVRGVPCLSPSGSCDGLQPSSDLRLDWADVENGWNISQKLMTGHQKVQEQYYRSEKDLDQDWVWIVIDINSRRNIRHLCLYNLMISFFFSVHKWCYIVKTT